MIFNNQKEKKFKILSKHSMNILNLKRYIKNFVLFQLSFFKLTTRFFKKMNQ